VIKSGRLTTPTTPAQPPERGVRNKPVRGELSEKGKIRLEESESQDMSLV
jgi:hypothetical protein